MFDEYISCTNHIGNVVEDEHKCKIEEPVNDFWENYLVRIIFYVFSSSNKFKILLLTIRYPRIAEMMKFATIIMKEMYLRGFFSYVVTKYQAKNLNNIWILQESVFFSVFRTSQ